MTIQQLKYILEVADKGSLSDAAKALFITQPTISRAIKEIEEDLGFEIFIRNSRGIEITSQGEEFVSNARQVLQQMDLLEDRYFNQKNTAMRFQVSSLHYSFVAEAFLKFLKESIKDNFDFRLKESTACKVMKDVQERKSELGILYMSDENEGILSKYLAERKLTFHPLFRMIPGVYVRKQHPLASKSTIRLEDLKEYPYISVCLEDDETVYMGEELFASRIASKKIGVTCGGTGIQYLKETDGYTISPATSSKRIREMDIVCVPLENSIQIYLGYITIEHAHLTVLAKKFIDVLAKYWNQSDRIVSD